MPSSWCSGYGTRRSDRNKIHLSVLRPRYHGVFSREGKILRLKFLPQICSFSDVFSMGFGPFRWVCCSRSDKDLQATDEIALQVLTSLSNEDGRTRRARDEICPKMFFLLPFLVPNEVRLQYTDNIRWIQNARGHNLVKIFVLAIFFVL